MIWEKFKKEDLQYNYKIAMKRKVSFTTRLLKKKKKIILSCYLENNFIV